MGAVAIGGGALLGLGGAYLESQGAQNAANTQAGAAEQASQLQYNEFEQQLQNEEPWISAGASALPQLSSMASQTPQFTMQDFYANQDPAYGFDVQQGENAIQQSAAANGSLLSTGTMTGLNNYAQQMASNEYQNAYSRYMNNQNTQFSRLASIAGLGQGSAGQAAQSGENMANNVSSNITGAANAQGAASIAGANAWGGTLSSLGSSIPQTWMGYTSMNNMNNLMNSLYNPTMSGGPSYGSAPSSNYGLGVDTSLIGS